MRRKVYQLIVGKVYIDLKKIDIAYPLVEKPYAILSESFGKEHILTREAWEALQKCQSSI